LDPDFIRELFSQFRPVTVKRMFGGAGLYCEGLMFGLVFDAEIYLKVDETSIPDFEREGSQPFVYTRAKSPLDGGADRVCAVRYGVNALVVFTADRIQEISASKTEVGIVFQEIAFAHRLERVTHRRGSRRFRFPPMAYRTFLRGSRGERRKLPRKQ